MPISLFQGNESLAFYNGTTYQIGVVFHNVSTGQLQDFKFQIKGTSGFPSGRSSYPFRVLLGSAADVENYNALPFFNGQLDSFYDSSTSYWYGSASIDKALPDRYPTAAFVCLWLKDPVMDWPVPLLTTPGWQLSPNPWPMTTNQAYVEVEI